MDYRGVGNIAHIIAQALDQHFKISDEHLHARDIPGNRHNRLGDAFRYGKLLKPAGLKYEDAVRRDVLMPVRIQPEAMV